MNKDADVAPEMTFRWIAERFEARDVELAASDKSRYIGTIMWQNQRKSLQLEGQEYWLREEPLPRTDFS